MTEDFGRADSLPTLAYNSVRIVHECPINDGQPDARLGSVAALDLYNQQSAYIASLQ